MRKIPVQTVTAWMSGTASPEERTLIRKDLEKGPESEVYGFLCYLDDIGDRILGPIEPEAVTSTVPAFDQALAWLKANDDVWHKAECESDLTLIDEKTRRLYELGINSVEERKKADDAMEHRVVIGESIAIGRERAAEWQAAAEPLRPATKVQPGNKSTVAIRGGRVNIQVDAADGSTASWAQHQSRSTVRWLISAAAAVILFAVGFGLVNRYAAWHSYPGLLPKTAKLDPKKLDSVVKQTIPKPSINQRPTSERKETPQAIANQPVDRVKRPPSGSKPAGKEIIAKDAEGDSLPRELPIDRPQGRKSLAQTPDELGNRILEMRKANVPADSPEVRALCKNIAAFLEANPSIDKTPWPKLTAFLDAKELPEDRLQRLKPVIQTVLAKSPGPVIPLNTEKNRQLFLVLSPVITKLGGTASVDPVILQFLNRVRGPDDTIGMIIPAYFDLATDEGWQKWMRLVRCGDSGVPMKVVLAQPTVRDENYIRAIEEAGRHHVKVLGGLSGQKGQNFDQVENAIKLWHDLYGNGLSGFYIVDQPADKTMVGYFANVFAAIRKRRSNYEIVSVPGSMCDEAYLSQAKANILCVSTGSQPPIAAAWMAAHDPSHFAAINFGIATAEGMKEHVNQLLANHISWVYVAGTEGFPGSTPIGQPDLSFQLLPSFLEEEVLYIRDWNIKIKNTATGATPKKKRPRG